jgi:signal transduction histidine kinase
LFQAIRELLFNVVKHSGSSKATVTMEQVDQDWAHIIVSDEGKGFDFTAIQNKKKRGRGLRSIQQEFKLFGCQLEVDSRENAGTRMIINIPIGNAVPGP